MKLTPRDKILALLLPALAVFAGYVSLFFYPTQRQMIQALKARDEARANRPQLEQQVMQTRGQKRIAEFEARRQEDEKTKLMATWNAAAGRCADANRRNDRIEKLNQLLSRHGLRVVEDAEADGGKDGKVAPALDGLAEKLAKGGEASKLQPIKPQVRRVRVWGTYLHVLAALQELGATSEVVAIPVGLAMQEAALNHSVREWTILVWI